MWFPSPIPSTSCHSWAGSLQYLQAFFLSFSRPQNDLVWITNTEYLINLQLSAPLLKLERVVLLIIDNTDPPLAYSVTLHNL